MRKYINLPYKNLGRDFSGVDCYGLLYLIYKKELQIDLPDFVSLQYQKEWYKQNENVILDNIWNQWEQISAPFKKFDALLFKLNSKMIVNHCGVYVGDQKFIHVYEDSPSCINRLEGPWLTYFYKGYRLKNG